MVITAYLRRLLVAISALLLAAPEASALQYGRSSLDLPLVGITATGPIVPGDFDRLAALVETLPQSDRTLGFFIDSPGGDISEAEKIATFINETAAAVTIPSGSQCLSACFLLFAAAAHRFMAPGALVGVHSASQNGQENLTSMGATTALARDAATYGVPPAIIGKMVLTGPGRVALLTPSDLQPMGVVLLTPSSPQAQPLPPPQAAPTTQATPANTFYVIVLGSKPTENEALAAFGVMQRAQPALLARYRPMVQKADLGAKGIWYRLRIGPIRDKANASKLCYQLNIPDCLVTTW